MLNRAVRTGLKTFITPVAGVCGLAALLTAASATAQNEPDNRFYVAPTFQYISADTDRLTDDGFGLSLSVGRRLTSGLNFELTGAFTELDNETGGESAELTSYGANLLLFPSRQRSNMFGILSVMHNENENHPSTDGNGSFDSTIADIGVGVLYDLFWRLDLRADARYRYDSHDRNEAGAGGTDGFYEAVINLGVQLPFGEDPNAAAEEEDAEIAVVDVVQDSDNDGVTDDVDQCPNTPPGTPVDNVGCALDSDGDGVTDNNDDCPNTPAGAIVDARGCSVDKDGDGVLNAVDECPNTPAGLDVLANGCAIIGDCRIPKPGEEVDENGCAVVTTVVLRGVTFEFDKARLTANAKVILDQVADALLSVPETNIEIGGHTDSRGSERYNQELSQRRADSVKTYLTGRGVNGSTLSTMGYGESQPIASNDTVDGRELNRRVELKILDGFGAPAGQIEANAVVDTTADDANDDFDNDGSSVDDSFDAGGFDDTGTDEFSDDSPDAFENSFADDGGSESFSDQNEQDGPDNSSFEDEADDDSDPFDDNDSDPFADSSSSDDFNEDPYAD